MTSNATAHQYHTDPIHSQSKRFKRLVDVVEKGLSESRKSIDTRAAVSDCYGEDAAIFAGAGSEDGATDMLANLIDGVIETANDRIKREMDTILKREKMSEKLAILDRVILEYEEKEREKQDVDNEDRLSAQRASEKEKPPDGVTFSDVLSFYSYQVKRDGREKLLEEIAAIEAENKSIVEQLETENRLIEVRMKEINEAGNALEKTANTVSLHGSS